MMNEEHMLTSDERKMLQKFQERLGELVDEFLKLGAEPEWLREIMNAEIVSDLEVRREELDEVD
jgi:hypothetical protein